MARKPSVILTPTEKKEAVKAAKEQVRDLKKQHAELTKARKQLDREYNAAVKANDRELAKVVKQLNKAELDLTKLVPPKAVPSPVGA